MIVYCTVSLTYVLQDILIKKGIVEKDDVLRGKGIDPDEQRLEKAIVSCHKKENIYIYIFIYSPSCENEDS